MNNFTKQQLQREIFMDVPGYEGMYQVSNIGRVKSLSRKVSNGTGEFISQEKILKSFLSGAKGEEYITVALSKDSLKKPFKMHVLQMKTFKPEDYQKCVDFPKMYVVDHKDNVRHNNNIENLQVITFRENASKDRKQGTSLYTGVYWYPSRNKWRAKIYINGKFVHLGYFKEEIDAHNAYQKALNCSPM